MKPSIREALFFAGEQGKYGRIQEFPIEKIIFPEVCLLYKTILFQYPPGGNIKRVNIGLYTVQVNLMKTIMNYGLDGFGH